MLIGYPQQIMLPQVVLFFFLFLSFPVLVADLIFIVVWRNQVCIAYTTTFYDWRFCVSSLQKLLLHHLDWA